MLIGLTGAYCAGKNHIASLLEAHGIEVLDVDKLGHRAIEEEKAAIVGRFGTGVQAPDGSIDRAALGALAFASPEALRDLEAMVHPAANRLTEEWIAARAGKDLALNAALLHRSSVFDRLDLIILVRAPFLTRLARARRRDGLSLKAILERFRAQKNFDAQYLSSGADIHIVDNRGAFGLCLRVRARALERRIDTILARGGMVR